MHYFLKSIFFTFFLFAISNALIAQNVNINWGSPLKNKGRSETRRIIGSDADGFYTLRAATGGYFADDQLFLDRYDRNNNQIFSKELIVPVPVKSKIKLKFQDIKYVKGQLYLFSSYFNKETDVYYTFANPVSKDGEVQDKMVEVAKMENISKAKNADASIVLASDSSKILIYQNRPYEKNAAEKIEIKVIDANLNSLYTKTLELPYRDKDVSINNYVLDNEGNTYVLMSVDRSKEIKNSKIQGYLFKVMGYFYAENQVREYDIQLQDKFITDVNFIIGPDQNLMVAGFYADNKKLNVGGLFFVKVDAKNKKVLNASSKDFTPSMLANFMSERKANKDDAGVRDLKMKQLVLRPDGNLLLAGEQQYVQVVTTRTQNVTYTTYHYYNLNMLFANVNQQGTIDWITVVPKLQHTVNDGGMYNSYSLALDKDKVQIIFNDNPKNMEDLTNKKVMGNPKKAVTVLVTLDSKGNYTKNLLFPAREAQTILQPSFYLRTPGKLVIYSEQGKLFRFGTIRFS